MVAVNLGVLRIERIEIVRTLLGHLSHPRYVFARELQIYRIEVAGFGKSCASSRSGGFAVFTEPTLVLHEVQITARVR
jgi:hypothetical protein